MAHILKQIWPLGERCRCAACGCEWMVTDPADLGAAFGRRLVVAEDGSRAADTPCPLCLVPCALYLPPPAPAPTDPADFETEAAEAAAPQKPATTNPTNPTNPPRRTRR